ncbi:MAG: histidine phosphatase family protein [Paenibacillaceae bacterium]
MAVVQLVDIYAVRHGVTLWNLEHKYLGHTDQPLHEEYIMDLLPLKKQMKGLAFNRILSSDLLRCRQTLDVLQPQGLEYAKVDARLREIHFGLWEGKTYEQMKEEPLYQSWLDDWMKKTPPKGESGSAVKQRVLDCMLAELDELTGSSKDGQVKCLLVVTHGGVIRMLLQYFWPDIPFWSWRVQNGKMLKWTIEKRGEWICCSSPEALMQANGNI